MDVGLPKLNGYEVARRIRSVHGGEIVLAAITGWGQEADRQEAAAAGFDHHLTKPVSTDSLAAILDTARVKLRWPDAEAPEGTE